jgi:hypothetical protein
MNFLTLSQVPIYNPGPDITSKWDKTGLLKGLDGALKKSVAELLERVNYQQSTEYHLIQDGIAAMKEITKQYAR